MVKVVAFVRNIISRLTVQKNATKYINLHAHAAGISAASPPFSLQSMTSSWCRINKTWQLLWENNESPGRIFTLFEDLQQSDKSPPALTSAYLPWPVLVPWSIGGLRWLQGLRLLRAEPWRSRHSYIMLSLDQSSIDHLEAVPWRKQTHGASRTPVFHHEGLGPGPERFVLGLLDSFLPCWKLIVDSRQLAFSYQ